MKQEVIISGFGGQGVLSMGKILAYAGIIEGKEVTWMPSYGPEQRGGTANVTVILSDNRITSPVLNAYDTAIVLNQPSLDRFMPQVKAGGTLIYDPASILTPPTRTDINIYSIEAMTEASKMQNAKVFNMLILGGLIKVCPIVSVNDVVQGLHKTLPERHHHLIPMNERAIRHGMDIIQRVPSAENV